MSTNTNPTTEKTQTNDKSDTKSTKPDKKKMPSLESLEKQGALHPWSQTHSQRLDLVRDLDHLSEQIIECQQTRCDELKHLYFEGVSLVVALKEPKAHWELEQCRNAGRAESVCVPPFIEAYNRWRPIMDRKLEDKRKNPIKRTPKW